MRTTPKLMLLLLLSSFSGTALAQQSIAQARLIKLSNPLYPPLARQANITGEVEVEMTVSRDAPPEAVILSGHPMLKEAALASARQSQFDGSTCSPSCHYILRYVFKQSDDRDCCGGFSVVPTVQQGPLSLDAVGRGETEIKVVAQHVCICDPAATITMRARSLKCLYLWKCSTATR